MLVILLPEQVMQYWDEVKYYIEAALPVHKQRCYDMQKVLMHVLGGVLLVAFLTDRQKKIIAVFSITIVRDNVTAVNNMEIMTGYALRQLEKEEIYSMMRTLKGLAREKKCGNIIFYTDIEDTIKSFEEGGWKKHSFMMWEV